ncbi:MAG: transcription termination/antitermination protein NusG [Clostridiales bacterium]|nr:transcription termination/antitermination protein NusG [Clostridiales bacterium]
MAERSKWYVVHTYSGYENKVANNIEKVVENRKMSDQILDVSVPTEKVTEIKDDKPKEYERKVFPGYVLVKLAVDENMEMSDDAWYVIRNTRGVTGFVGPGSKPVPLSEAEVEALGVEKKLVKVDYNVGDTVTITLESLKGTSGVVEELDVENNYVLVKIFMLGRETNVELTLNQVELPNK